MRVGIFGHPLSHSLAPRLFARIFELAGLPLDVELFPTGDHESVQEIMSNRDVDFASVLSPLKRDVLRHVDYVDDDARKFDAADWLRREGYMLAGGLCARRAIWRFLDRRSDEIREMAVAAVAGYGVAATSVMDVLYEFGISRFLMLAREPMRALPTADRLLELGLNVEVWPERIGELSEELPCDVFVNATPVGLWPKTDGLIIPPRVIKGAAYVLDLNYRPHPTRLVREAEKLGIHAETGSELLVHKSLLQVESWTGKDFSSEFEALCDFIREEAAE